MQEGSHVQGLRLGLWEEGRLSDIWAMFSFQIQEDPSLCGDKPSISAVTVELSKETLDTMLDGLGRIRDQLSAVANK